MWLHRCGALVVYVDVVHMTSFCSLLLYPIRSQARLGFLHQVVVLSLFGVRWCLYAICWIRVGRLDLWGLSQQLNGGDHPTVSVSPR